MVEACIICHETKSGTAVEDTLVLRSLRKLKADFPPMQMLWGKPTGNTLVVCPGCVEKFEKKHKAYEGKVLLHVLLAAGLMVFIVVLPIVGGTFTLGSLLVGLLLVAMLMALPLLDYVPPLHKDESAQKPQQRLWGMPAPKESVTKEQAQKTYVSEPVQMPVQSYEPPIAPEVSKQKTKTAARSHEKKSKPAHGKRR